MTVERMDLDDDPGANPPDDENDLTLPPHSLQAEEAVLGSVLKHPAALSRVITELRPDDFYKPENRQVYEAMVTLFRRNVPCDYHTIGSELERLGYYESSGGMLYLSQLSLATPTSSHIEHYGGIVRDHATRRRGIAAAQSIAEVFYRRREAIEEEMRRATAYLYSVTGRESGRKLLYPEEWVGRYLDRLAQIDEDGALGISTGWIDVDRATLGLVRGTLWLVAARPGLGKSEFVEQMALSVASGLTASGGGCHAAKGWSLFVSIEMTEEELAERAASQWAMVNKERLIRGHMQDQEYSKLADALNHLADCRLALAVESGITTQDVRAMALQLEAEKGPLDLIVVDYVQLLKDKKAKDSSRADDIGYAANELKRLAGEMNCTVVACAQLNRGVEERRPPIPILSDLRDSGELEQAADVALMIYRDEVYNPDTDKRGVTDFIVRKHRRYGKLTGTQVQLLYVNRFLDLERYRS